MKSPLWRQRGSEPDYRYSLANERTFLAWIRSALALLAAGLLLDQPGMAGSPAVRTGLALGLCVLAVLASASAYRRWRGNEIAMRHAAALPHSPALALLCLAMLAIGAGVCWLLLSHA
ncbi:hypothetical protein BI147_27480 [Achromobacter xylosoxidans]|uniref:YidH family protein n=1 Tax=Alcaligenes xylosoxydans xylosoxydans TaxID=85698 RepID=UPI000735457D|nr:DUF202 domain-containing protein [Achromobacter xylosoxidans]OMG82872.1 hypothetical protein BI147_27480 [Achromobacter xylosoxidans]PNM89290.1 DUF202 domain-containing protein [Achromobacter xylosoxidans]